MIFHIFFSTTPVYTRNTRNRILWNSIYYVRTHGMYACVSRTFCVMISNVFFFPCSAGPTAAGAAVQVYHWWIMRPHQGRIQFSASSVSHVSVTSDRCVQTTMSTVIIYTFIYIYLFCFVYFDFDPTLTGTNTEIFTRYYYTMYE